MSGLYLAKRITPNQSNWQWLHNLCASRVVHNGGVTVRSVIVNFLLLGIVSRGISSVNH